MRDPAPELPGDCSFAESPSSSTSPGFSAPSPSSGSAFRPITSEACTGPAQDAGEVSYAHLYSLGIPPAGLSAPANLNTWPVLCLQFTFHCKVSQNHCHLGRWWGRGCPVLGTPQATQPLARGYGEGNLLCKERGEQPCIKNSGCTDSEAGSSSSLSSMESWPTSWFSAPFPGGQ